MPDQPTKQDNWVCQECAKNGKPKNVSWIIFSWTIGLFIVAIGWAFARTEGLSVKVNDNQANMSVISERLGKIETDIGWIKEALQSIKGLK